LYNLVIRIITTYFLKSEKKFRLEYSSGIGKETALFQSKSWNNRYNEKSSKRNRIKPIRKNVLVTQLDVLDVASIFKKRLMKVFKIW
jgi:hypothetical protein